MKRKDMLKGNVIRKILAAVIIVIMVSLGYVAAKYVFNEKSETELSFHRYVISETDVKISPDRDEKTGEIIYTGDGVTVTITAPQKTGLKIQYQIGDDGEWKDYTTPFGVEENGKVNTRYVGIDSNYTGVTDEFEGPSTSVDITNIAVAKIGDKTYKTIEAAIADWPNVPGTNKKIELLTDVTENVVIPENKEIVIDLNGRTLTNEVVVPGEGDTTKTTITINGKLDIVDTKGNGKIESTTSAPIKVGEHGELTIGTNESVPNVGKTPVIEGEEKGIIVEEGGKLNFYDGKIIGGTTAIDGTIEDVEVPDGYGIRVTTEDGKEVAELAKIYTVTINTDGGTITNPNGWTVGNGNTTAEKTILAGDAYGSLPEVEKVGYDFEGWKESEEDEDLINETTPFGKGENVELIPVYTPYTYTIKYSANDDKATGTTADTTCTYDQKIKVAQNGYTKTGYTFKGWNTAANGSGTTYAENAEITTNLTNVKNAEITFYAMWADETKPTNTKPSVEAGVSVVTVTNKQSDDGSGIETVKYQIGLDTNNNGKIDDNEWSNWQDSNVFTGLTQDTEYSVRTKATDKSGNTQVSEIEKTKTQKIQGATADVYENDNGHEGEEVETTSQETENPDWTDKDVIVKVTVPESTENRSTTVTVKKPGETNGTTTTVTTSPTNIPVTTDRDGEYVITITTTDGTNTATETHYVYVDKTNPTVNPTYEKTTNSITVTPNATDSGSGIEEIKYKIEYTDKNGVKQEKENSTGIFTNLPEGTEITVTTTVTDKAGNVTEVTGKQTTPALVAGTVAFKEKTTNTAFTPAATVGEDKVWVNEDVKTTLTNGNAGTTTYTVQKVGGAVTGPFTGNVDLPTTDGDYVVVVTTTDGTNTKTVEYYFSVDKTLPTVGITQTGADRATSTGAEYTIPVGSTNATISATLTPEDNANGSGIATKKYAFSTSSSTEPGSWTDLNDTNTASKTVSGGVYYLWTKVIDNAGNEATTIKTSKEFNVGYEVAYDTKGGSAVASQRKVHNTNLILTNTIPTKNGFIFKKWATNEDGTGTAYNAGAAYTTNAPIKLYAVWAEVVATLTVNGTTTNYDSVQAAIDAAGTNSATVTLVKANANEIIEVLNGQNITLNLNGKTLTSDGTTITNNGNIKVTGNGTVSSTAVYADGTQQGNQVSTISNNGKLVVNKATIVSTNNNAIKNNANGKLTIEDGTITAAGHAIYNLGTATGKTEPSVKVNGGEVKSTAIQSIYNAGTGTVYVNGGTVNGSNHGIRNSANGKIIVDTGTVSSLNEIGIFNVEDGEIEINGGTISGQERNT